MTGIVLAKGGTLFLCSGSYSWHNKMLLLDFLLHGVVDYLEMKWSLCKDISLLLSWCKLSSDKYRSWENGKKTTCRRDSNIAKERQGVLTAQVFLCWLGLQATHLVELPFKWSTWIQWVKHAVVLVLPCALSPTFLCFARWYYLW